MTHLSISVDCCRYVRDEKICPSSCQSYDYDNVMHCRDDLAHISISQQFLATISFPKSSETGD